MSLLSLLTKYSNTLDGDTYFSHLFNPPDVSPLNLTKYSNTLDGDTYFSHLFNPPDVSPLNLTKYSNTH